MKVAESQIGKTDTDWMGFILSKNGIKLVNSKIQAITEKIRPKNMKELRSFMGAINQMNRFRPSLANLNAPLMPLLEKDTTLGLDRNTGTSIHNK